MPVEGKPSHTQEESGCNEKNTDVILAKNFTLKNPLETFHNIDGTKAKVSEADPNLVRTMTVHQDIETMLAPYHVRQHDEARHSPNYS